MESGSSPMQLDGRATDLWTEDPAFFSELTETPRDVAAVEILLAKQTKALAALRESEARFRSTFDYAAVGMALIGLDGRWLQVNRSLCQIVGYTEHELLVRDFQSITHPEDLANCLSLAGQLLDGGVPNFQSVKRYVHRQGHAVWVLTSVSLVRDAFGKPIHFISQVQDITERKRAEQLERDRRQVLEMVAKDMPLPDVLGRLAAAMEPQVTGSIAAVMVLQDGEVLLHGPGMPSDWSDALREHSVTLTASLAAGTWEAADGCGVTHIGEHDLWRAVRPAAARHGILSCWTMPIRATDTAALGLLTIFTREARRPTHPEVQTLDMAAKLAAICIEHHNTTRQLSHLVRHDPLTGMANRIMFEDRLQLALNLARRRGECVAVMLLDIDKFKSINDTWGHQAGDHLLQQFAHRLRSRLRATDTMARLGGDEFAIVLQGVKTRDDAALVARKLVESLIEPFPIGDRAIAATTSIGIAVSPADSEDAVTLQKKADEALYRAKDQGRNGFSF